MMISEWFQLWGQTVLTGALVIITGIYAWRTHVISKATKQQAEASVKMAEATSRPFMIPKAMPTIINGTETEVFSHFEVHNEGKGPAIEVQVSLLDKEKSPMIRQDKGIGRVYRETPVRTGEPAIPRNASCPDGPFYLADLPESTYYIVCEYQSISSRLSKEQTWYQTWLPFQRCTSSQGGVRVEPNELFEKKVLGNKRIDAFGKLKSMLREKSQND